MKVDIISGSDEFKDIRDAWSQVYQSDPDAQIYLSWTWLSNWLSLIGRDWLILAAREPASGAYVAFFPIRLRTQSATAGGCYTDIAMAGNRFADDTGPICRPEFAMDAIPAMVRELLKLKFAILRFENLRLNPKYLPALLDAIPKSAFDVIPASARDRQTGIDNAICPFAVLPKSWDAFLAGLSANSRQKLRRLLRQVEASERLSIARATEQSIDSDLASLLAMWRDRWRTRKQERTEGLSDKMAIVLRRSFADGQLEIVTLRDEGRIVAAHANYVEDDVATTSFFVGARDLTFSGPSPGLVLHAHSIAEAIKRGHSRFEFLRGDEPYKFTFATACRTLHNIIIKACPARMAEGCLDTRSIQAATTIVAQLVAAENRKAATVIFRQLVRMGPAGTHALAKCGWQAVERKDSQTARAVFLLLTRVEGRNASHWLGLGYAHGLRSEMAAAEQAFEHATAINPRLAPAHYFLGVMHTASGAQEAARKSFRRVVDIDPCFRDAARRLGMLTPKQRDGEAGAEALSRRTNT